MFGLGWQEIAIVAVVLIIVVGPDDLPGLLRTVGRWVGSLQGMARDFRRQIDTMADDAGLAEERKLFDQARSLNPTKMLKDAIDPLGEIEKDLTETNQAVEEASLAARTQNSDSQALWQPDVGAKDQVKSGSKSTAKSTVKSKAVKSTAKNGGKTQSKGQSKGKAKSGAQK